MGEKQQWSNEHLKCLLETCIEEINTVGRKGLSLHKDSWNNLGKVLNEKFGLDLTKKQMKNAYDNLKAKYVGWVYLKNKTGNIYNAQTNNFTLTNEEWEEFKKAASLKTVPLPFQELCAELFDGNTVTGNCKWTSTQTTSGVGSSCHRIQSLMIMDTRYHDTQDDAGTSEPTFEPTSEPTSEPTPEPNLNKRAKTSKPSTNHDDLARDMQKALQFFIKGKKGQ
ncbi:putative Myb/SANT-like domain-containing protein [Helianthus annuus]|nr:putative Myb/SANT-like domain-containing protein [Helianthus annuus]